MYMLPLSQGSTAVEFLIRRTPAEANTRIEFAASVQAGSRTISP
jgi:hypothetical protein